MARPDAEPRFTVIIPTKDRAQYLYHTLRTCSIQEYENLEIIVSDDGSVDDTRAVVEEAARKDARIRYVTPGPGMGGMLGNFEFVLDQVKPGYVIALGGDDGLLPHGIRGMLEVLQETGQEMLAWPAGAYFYRGARIGMGQLVLRIRHGRPHTGRRVLSSRTFLERQTRELHYVGDAESPMFYVKGVVSTRLIERVRARTPGRRFYACTTPDGYSGIVLAGETPTYAFSGNPFSLHGVSPTSAGMGYLAGSEPARRQSEAFFKMAADRPMHRELGSQPYSPLICLMTADYLLTARDLPGWPGVFPAIDFRRLLRTGLWELQDGLFAPDRIPRELSILRGVAGYHGLHDWFTRLVRRSHRNRRQPLKGNAISRTRAYIDASQFGIENVFDAAYFSYYAHAMPSAITPRAVWGALTNSVHYRLLSLRRGERFPDEAEWIIGAGQPSA